MKLYDIIKSLQSAQGNIAKQSILDENKDNVLFKAYMKAVYDVGINYYMKKSPKVHASSLATVDLEFVDWIVACIAGRVVTGKDAENVLKMNLAAMDAEGQELVQYILDRKIGASVGDTMVLKTWPDLYFLPPYNRCSLLDDKAKERFEKLFAEKKHAFVQTKFDGSFGYVVHRNDGSMDIITRQGSKYPQGFAKELAQYVPKGSVLVGELMVGVANYNRPDAMLERKEANGILNSCLKDGDGLEQYHRVHVHAWDMLTQEEFEAGKSNVKYIERLQKLKNALQSAPANINVAETWAVGSMKEAYDIYTDHTSRGLEGCILKNPDSLWKDGTSKEMVKMKIKFEVEMRITGTYEGEGKAACKLGGIYIESEDGGIQCACGSGFNDSQREQFWDTRAEMIGKVVAVEANDITQSREVGKKPSLSLPIFVEVRNDKTVADTTERIYAQLESAKHGHC